MNTKLTQAIKDYGQARLAREANLSPAMVSWVVSGERSFGKKTAPIVAQILNVPVTVALGME